MPSALLLGSAGLVLVFWRNAGFGGGRGEWLGVAAIVAGTFCYCLGRGAVATAAADARAAAAHDRAGDRRRLALAALSAAFETVTAATFRALLTPKLIAALLAVSLLGTIVGYSIYLRLLRVWGAFRAGLYAFVSPVVALAAGALAFGENDRLARARRRGGDACRRRRRDATARDRRTRQGRALTSAAIGAAPSPQLRADGEQAGAVAAARPRCRQTRPGAARHAAGAPVRRPAAARTRSRRRARA